ncbi:MAG: hypothetical protein ACRC32_20895 [Chroococcidiopsis sp.]
MSVTYDLRLTTYQPPLQPFDEMLPLLVVNPALRFELLLLAIALLNAAICHWQFSKSRQMKQLIFVKAIAIISLLAWTGIVICGRFIAYT